MSDPLSAAHRHSRETPTLLERAADRVARVERRVCTPSSDFMRFPDHGPSEPGRHDRNSTRGTASEGNRETPDEVTAAATPRSGVFTGNSARSSDLRAGCPNVFESRAVHSLAPDVRRHDGRVGVGGSSLSFWATCTTASTSHLPRIGGRADDPTQRYR